MARLLIVDDEAAQRRILVRILEGEGHEVAEAASVPEAFAALNSHAPEVVLSDLKMPGQGGMELLEYILKQIQPPEVIMATAHATVETAVRAMRLGAYDYLTKPLGRDELVLLVERAAENFRLRLESKQLRQTLEGNLTQGLIAASPAMQQILDMVERVAPSDSTVLIRGETGTGKERIARLIHLRSPRASHPMTAINCAAFPESLLESELFGYEKGAFTGALARKIGLVESASGGTLFLDEVGEMPASTQVKLLRVIQEREIRRVGSNHTVPVNIRIIAATHRDLESEIRAGRFREDLFYRLNVIPCTLAPLRERREDIPPLVKHFLARAPLPKTIDPEALQHLCTYSWPGNVRELEAVIERIAVLSIGQNILPADLPAEIRRHETVQSSLSVLSLPPQIPAQGIVFEDWERQLLFQALQQARGSMADAARLLGMTYRTFQYRAEKFGLRAES